MKGVVMMKKKFGLVLMVLIMLFSIGRVSADETLKATNVRVEITINDNNSYDIIETIDIEFATPHHGINRTIPLYNTIIRQDGSTGSNSAVISNINVNETYETTYSGGYCNLRIGDADVLVEGSKRYIIKYRYDIGNDEMKNGDEFYFNIIGDSWTYDIENLQVVLHFPKDFDIDKLGVSHGTYGSADYSGVKQKREDNTVFLEYSEVLHPGESFTVRCEFEEGYFKKSYSIKDILASIFCPLIAVLLALFNTKNYMKHGKPDVVVQTVEFYPPENMTPPKMFHTAFNYTNKESVTGLLLLLAQKGYLKIEEKEDDTYQFEIYEKPTDGLSHEEKLYYEGLVKCAEEQEDGRLIAKDEVLKKKFYSTVSEVTTFINSKSERVYEKGRAWYIFLSFISALILVMIVPAALYIFNAYRSFRWYHWAALVISVAVAIYQFILAFKYKKRTEENNRLYGMILGFKEFLLFAEKDRLEMLAEENPMYFYDILPYAYALGVSSVWIGKFSDMALPPVSWYEGTSVVRLMNDTVSSFNEDTSSFPYGDSDSGSWTDSSGWSDSSSSGGGFSGGGSGGGGSSGW